MTRVWILRLLIVGAIWVIISRLPEIEALGRTLAGAHWTYLLAAAILQFGFWVAHTLLYQTCFRAMGVSGRLRDLLPVMFSSIFISVVAPATGTALWVDDAVQRGQSGVKAAAATVLVRILYFSAFAVVLMVGLGWLYRYHDLTIYEKIASVLLLLVIVGWAAVLLMGQWFPSALRWLLSLVGMIGNWLASRVGRPGLIPPGWVENSAQELTQAASAVASHPAVLLPPAGAAVACEVIDLASFYALFLAFDHPVSLGVLVAGYAVGILFWIIAITPQGIGVVETTMPLALASLDVPMAKALTISLAFRGLGFWLPLLAGFILVHRVPSFRKWRHPAHTAASVAIVSLLTALMGIVNLLSGITPSLAARLHLIRADLPLEVRHGGHLAASMAGFALIMLARGLSRHKRIAWLLTLLVLGVSIVSHLVKGLDYEEATLAAALALWLLSLRGSFNAVSDPPSVTQGLIAVAAALVFTLAYGTLGLYLLDRHFSLNFGLAAALKQSLVMFTEFGEPSLQPITGFGRYFARSIYLVAALTFAYALVMLLRPVLMRRPATAAQRRRARDIVEAHGRSSLAHIALLPDKHYHFSTAGSVTPFAVRGATAVALGDPIGPPDDARDAIREFAEHCRRHDWQPAWFQVLPDYLDLYTQAGYQTLRIGHEAIVDVTTFSLAGGEAKGLRHTINRLTKLGYEAQVHSPPLSPRLIAQLREVSDDWLTSVHGTEKRFSLGWFDEEYLRDCPVMAIHDAAGIIMAFANLIPEYQLNEATIDLMRQRRETERGTMDLLFVRLFEYARDQGHATFNLGLSPLAGIGEAPGDPALERVLHYVFESIDRFYDFKGLYEFKSKFNPEWQPRFLIYPNAISLPTVWTALERAQSANGFAWAYLWRK
ncbi:MAG: flippase-like domain-containing protein [Armatimonadia bacterium]